METVKKLKAILFVTLGITVVMLVSYGLLYFTGTLNENPMLEQLFIFAIPPVFIVFAVTFGYFIARKTLLNELIIENSYNMGRESSFFNYHALQVSIKRMRQWKHRNSTAYVVAFSPSNTSLNMSGDKNSVICSLNSVIADYFDKYFTTHGLRARLNNVYCFYHGYFIIYSFMRNEFIDNFMNALSEDLFKIAEEHEIHFFVQPFFGVTEVLNPKEPIQASINNAITALGYSSKNFQEKTYYDERLVKTVTDDDIREIQKAIEQKEFIVYYQPKFSLKESQVVSSEALIRWNSPKYGFSGPDKFLPKAEQGGLMHDIDMYVFRRVCEDLSETKRRGRRLLPVSVNFSLFEFYAPNFLTDLTDILKSFDLDPKLIEIEITEGTSQANSFLAVSYLKKIKEQGLQILMDDFGTGYSNIANLCKLPIDKLKIDKSLVDNLVDDVKTQESVRYLINLCAVNGMESIAEGVDNLKQVEILKKLKCDTIQGYYYSRPISKEQFDNFLVENTFEKRTKRK